MSVFRHVARLRVRNYEVDWQGIVHNSLYLQYFEVGRIEYLRAIGQVVNVGAINRRSRVVLARNEVDYLKPATFDDEIEVRSRISEVGRTSFVFEGELSIRGKGGVIARNRAIHVWLHPKSGRPVRVPAAFIRRVEGFEKRKIPRKK